MYGVPADLDLSFLRGAVLAQVHLMPSEINFVFHPDGRFFVEGEWELIGSDRSLIDRSMPWPRAEPFQLHRLLNKTVIGWDVSAPRSLALRFEDGLVLRLLDSSDRYESFMIDPGCIVA
jgi:hypothetical protein